MARGTRGTVRLPARAFDRRFESSQPVDAHDDHELLGAPNLNKAPKERISTVKDTCITYKGDDFITDSVIQNVA